MRIAVLAGGLAGLSALVAAIATSAAPAGPQVVTVQPDSPGNATVVRYVTQVVTLPPGATVPPDAGQNVLVTQLPAPVATPRTVFVTTTQSGRVVKP